MTGSRRTLLALLGLAAALSSGAATAQQSNPIAEKLFLEARTLLKQGQTEKACATFKASHDLDPTATGTLLNLALCHEQMGRTASAWAEHRQVAAESQGRRDDRVTLAREHEAQLFARLSFLRVSVPREADSPGLVLRLDGGATIDRATWETDVPVDPGPHVIEVTATKKKPGRQEVKVGESGDHARITIGRLENVPEPRAVDDGRTRRLVGFVAGGVGVAAAGVGLAFGATARSRNDDANALCPDRTCADLPSSMRANESQSSAGDAAAVANVLVGAGAILVATGIVLVVTGLPTRSRTAFQLHGLGGTV